VALLIVQEALLAIVGGVFRHGGAVRIIQAASPATTGRRVSRWRRSTTTGADRLERSKVIFGFLIMAIIFALFSLTTLKLRQRHAHRSRARCRRRRKRSGCVAGAARAAAPT
jgi:phospho-N-acetylmuramoyl-pentapeptide-transferase